MLASVYEILRWGVWSRGSVFLWCISSMCLVGLVSVARAFDAEEYLTQKPYEGVFEWEVIGADAVDIGKIIWEDQAEWGSVVEELLGWLWFRFDSDQKIIQFVSNLINFFLAIAWLVALAMLVYAFYKIFWSDGEEAFKEARGTIWKIFLALLVIWLAWFIAGWAFDLYFTVTEG